MELVIFITYGALPRASAATPGAHREGLPRLLGQEKGICQPVSTSSLSSVSPLRSGCHVTKIQPGSFGRKEKQSQVLWEERVRCCKSKMAGPCFRWRGF